MKATMYEYQAIPPPRKPTGTLEKDMIDAYTYQQAPSLALRRGHPRSDWEVGDTNEWSRKSLHDLQPLGGSKFLPEGNGKL